MMTTSDFLSEMAWGNSIQQWLIAGGTVAVLLLAGLLTRRLFLRRFTRLAQSTSTPWDDLIVDWVKRTHPLTLVTAALWIGVQLLERPASGPSPAKLFTAVSTVAGVGVALQLAWWGNGVVSFLIRRLKERQSTSAALPQAAFNMLALATKIVLWSVVLLATLANLGVDVSSLVAGLGIGGVAIALAIQKILGDLFCSVSILLDKPFEGGDFIVAGTQMGTVERVGLKTTRVRSLGGEEIIFPNADLVGSRIQNFKRMRERRVVFSFGVRYETPASLLEEIPHMVREIVAQIEKARLDRVNLKALGDYALIFEVVYYVTLPDYALYMDVQEQMNLALIRRFQEKGVAFAYPTQTVFVGSPSGIADSPQPLPAGP